MEVREFIEARLAEDEAWARSASVPPERGLGPAYGFSMEREQRPRWDTAAFGVERLPVRVETKE